MYVPHDGTIKIAGKTLPWGAAVCALNFMSEGKVPIEFLAIGGNANQQAAKTMASFALEVPKRFPGKQVSFVPLFYTTMANSASGQVQRTCLVWKTMIHTVD